jgi:membrane-bound metal-dependent hydrolase YbcI (DUF457 family)
MFVGHYGPAFAVKAADRTIPLWLLFLAVQFVDVLWAIFVLVDIEKVRIVPGITAASPLDLYYVPYTHSLIGSIAWAGVAAVAYKLTPRLGSWKAGLWIALAVFSHWILDLLVHRPDLPLYGNTTKVGFGLWNYPVLAFVLEAAFLFGGMYLYFTKTKVITTGGRYGMIVFGIIMLAIQGSAFFGPPPGSDKQLAVTALLSYGVFAAVIYLLEKNRMPAELQAA